MNKYYQWSHDTINVVVPNKNNSYFYSIYNMPDMWLSGLTASQITRAHRHGECTQVPDTFIILYGVPLWKKS